MTKRVLNVVTNVGHYADSWILGAQNPRTRLPDHHLSQKRQVSRVPGCVADRATAAGEAEVAAAFTARKDCALWTVSRGGCRRWHRWRLR